jgi:hypothetical protein
LECARDAERPVKRSHAERGNEERSPWLGPTAALFPRSEAMNFWLRR